MNEILRCGRADDDRPRAIRSVCKWNVSELAYAFVNEPEDMELSEAAPIIRKAFDAWAAHTPLTFVQTALDKHPHIKIAWMKGAHGDTSSFDGQGGTLAHAYFPPPCGGQYAGQLHFDEAELYTERLQSNGIWLYSVVLHEIGHILGLEHDTQDETAIMYPTYAPQRRDLAPGDIRRIQALYGKP